MHKLVDFRFPKDTIVTVSYRNTLLDINCHTSAIANSVHFMIRNKIIPPSLHLNFQIILNPLTSAILFITNPLDFYKNT